MKIGIISDIHSNYRAFEACINYLKSNGVDIFLLLGDYVSDTPAPEKVMKKIYDLIDNYKVIAIRGNREDYFLRDRQEDCGWVNGSQTGNLLYTKEHLTDKDMEFFSHLPVTKRLITDGYPSITICHGSPERTTDHIYMDTIDADNWLEKIDTDYLIAGHTHQRCIYRSHGKTYINVGSCGIAIHNAAMAECVLLTGNNHDWDIKLCSVPYDVYGLVDEVFSSGLYERAHWFMNSNIQTLTTGIDRASKLIDKTFELMDSPHNNLKGQPPKEEYFEKAAKILGIPDYSNDRHPILIRMATRQDAKQILSIYAPYVTDTAVTFETVVPTLEEFTERIRNTRKKYPYMVAVSNGEILGYAYASQFRTRAAYAMHAELSIYVRKDQHRKGIGGLLLDAMEEALRRQRVVNLYSVVVDCETDSRYIPKESIGFHEKHGFVTEARLRGVGVKFDEWFDTVYLVKRIGNTNAEPYHIEPYFTEQ